jgi:hypothetical protein
VGSGVVAADADVVESSGVAQGQAAGVIDAVASDPVVGVEAFAGSGFGPGGVDGGWGGAPGHRAVWAVVVVFVDEGVDLRLQLGDGVGAGLADEPAFEGFGGIVRPCRRWWGGWGWS